MRTVFYTVQPSDSPPRIAEKILGAGMSYRWPDLIAANPQKLMRGSTFANLTIGERLRVPFAWLPTSYAYAASSPSGGGGCASSAVYGLGDPRPGKPPPTLNPPPKPDLAPPSRFIHFPKGLLDPVAVPVPGGAVLPVNSSGGGAAGGGAAGGGAAGGGAAGAASTTSAIPWVIAGLVALVAVGVYVYTTRSRDRRRDHHGRRDLVVRRRRRLYGK